MAAKKEKTAIVLDNFRQHKTDTGSTEVQIATLTGRINHLIEHLKAHKKDNHTKRGLIVLVGRRRRLMKYLQKNNPNSLEKVGQELGLKINM